MQQQIDITSEFKIRRAKIREYYHIKTILKFDIILFINNVLNTRKWDRTYKYIQSSRDKPSN